MRREGVEHLIEFNAHVLGFDDDLFDLVAEELSALFAAGIGQDGDDGADAGASFKQAFVDEVSDDLVGGVGIDFEFLAERAHGRKGIAGAELAADHGFFGCVDDLLEERDAGAVWNAEGDHVCTITRSTVVN